MKNQERGERVGNLTLNDALLCQRDVKKDMKNNQEKGSSFRIVFKNLQLDVTS